MYGHGPLQEGMPKNDMTELHDTGLFFQILSNDTDAYWLFYMLKDKDEPKYRRYTPEEVEELAQQYATHPVSIGKTVTFGDLWRTKAFSNLYDLEEACAGRWYRGRAATVGDSSHKVLSTVLSRICEGSLSDCPRR